MRLRHTVTIERRTMLIATSRDPCFTCGCEALTGLPGAIQSRNIGSPGMSDGAMNCSPVGPPCATGTTTATDPSVGATVATRPLAAASASATSSAARDFALCRKPCINPTSTAVEHRSTQPRRAPSSSPRPPSACFSAGWGHAD